MLVVGAQLSQHVFWTDEFGIVVFQPLIFCNIANGAKRRPADLTRPLGDIVRHRKDLRRLLVEALLFPELVYRPVVRTARNRASPLCICS